MRFADLTDRTQQVGIVRNNNVIVLGGLFLHFLHAVTDARKRVHTDLTLAVKPGPLTLVFPKWIPGEHGPTGPLDTLIGMTIRANGTQLSWARDPRA